MLHYILCTRMSHSDMQTILSLNFQTVKMLPKTFVNPLYLSRLIVFSLYWRELKKRLKYGNNVLENLSKCYLTVIKFQNIIYSDMKSQFDHFQEIKNASRIDRFNNLTNNYFRMVFFSIFIGQLNWWGRQKWMMFI